jgi:hypothetical protein
MIRFDHCAVQEAQIQMSCIIIEMSRYSLARAYTVSRSTLQYTIEKRPNIVMQGYRLCGRVAAPVKSLTEYRCAGISFILNSC